MLIISLISTGCTTKLTQEESFKCQQEALSGCYQSFSNDKVKQNICLARWNQYFQNPKHYCNKHTVNTFFDEHKVLYVILLPILAPIGLVSYFITGD